MAVRRQIWRFFTDRYLYLQELPSHKWAPKGKVIFICFWSHCFWIFQRSAFEGRGGMDWEDERAQDHRHLHRVLPHRHVSFIFRIPFSHKYPLKLRREKVYWKPKSGLMFVLDPSLPREPLAIMMSRWCLLQHKIPSINICRHLSPSLFKKFNIYYTVVAAGYQNARNHYSPEYQPFETERQLSEREPVQLGHLADLGIVITICLAICLLVFAIELFWYKVSTINWIYDNMLFLYFI